GGPEIKFSQTTEYDLDGRILSTSSINPDGSKAWVTTNTYDDNGRLTKTVSGTATETGTGTLYAYDEAGRLLSITKSGKEVGSKSEFHYDEQGRKTAVQHFDPNVKRAQAAYAGSLWDAAVEGGAWVPVGGNITTIYDGNDQPTEAQIRDGEGRIVTRFVRTYDANGRILEEKQILENPVSLMADKLAPEEHTAAQLEAMNTVMKLMLGGPSGAGITYAYDAQGRVTEKRQRNFGFDTVTTISYNEHGDPTAQRETMTRDSADPGVTAYSVDPNGTITPERRGTERTESPDLARENEVRYEYEYDSYGNWAQQTENHGYGPDKPSYVLVRHRKLTYY
ncbi:MAG TPA: hypothetical protein VF749_22565, partial [Candidatus Acidoferrum sp.]